MNYPRYRTSFFRARSYFSAAFILLFFPLFFISEKSFSQAEENYDLISVYVIIQQAGGTEMPAILKGNSVYLPVADLFYFLRVKTVISQYGDSVSGFFLNPSMPYCIDAHNNVITMNDKKFDIPPGDIMMDENNLYLKDTYYDKFFGLSCKFSFRALSVNIIPAVELPVVREMRLETMRKNVNHLRGETQADTVIERSYPMFSFGMTDWSVISNQILNGPSDNRVNISLGGILFGGEANVGINYASSRPFTEKDQYYLWRYANNEFKAVRQIMAGKINSQATSSIYSPIVGFQVTNAPTTYRRSFGYYTISDYTQPGWIVELYVNNVLVDYLRADASGFFTFQVPMVYGNSSVKMKFYGPWGEEKIREQNISVPYNFLPAGELEYTVSGGIVEDSLTSRYSRGNINYGITRWLTMGAGVEYLSSVTSGSTMPFVNASMRIGSAFLVSGEYTYDVRFKGVANYRLPSNVQFDLMYINYHPGQTAINYNIREERKFVVSAPLGWKKVNTYARFTIDQLILPATSSATAELLFSGSFYGVNANFTTYAMLTESSYPYYYSNLALGFRLPHGIMLTPQAQYEYKDFKIISAKIELEKQFHRYGSFNISYERNVRSRIDNFQAGLRYDFSGIQAAFTYRQTNNIPNFIESARGSLIVDKKTDTYKFLNRSVTGRGGIVAIPFLDLNDNGRRDEDEQKLSGLNMRINGGVIQENKNDTVIRILDLEPYTYYVLEADQNSIQNIAWRLDKRTYKIYIDPNQLKLVEIAVSILGEASGFVYLEGKGGMRGQSRITINFFSEKGEKRGSVMSESDGFFSSLSFPPGKYYAEIDQSQMNKVGLINVTGRIPFEIRKTIDGDVVSDLEFILRSSKPSSDVEPVKKDTVSAGSIPAVKKEIKTPVVPDEIKKSVTIRAGAFKNLSNAEKAREKLENIFPGKVTLVKDTGLIKVEITVNPEDVKNSILKLKNAGFPDAYLLN